MRRKLLPTALALILFSLGYIFWNVNASTVLARTEGIYNKIKIFTSILETIQRVYIDEKHPDELIEDAIKGVLSNLDPHTAYLPADDFKSWNQNFEGYTGIGISFEIIDDKITVMSTIESGPADNHGIRPGDKIVEIDSESVIGMHGERVTEKMMGAVGSAVDITVESDRWMHPKTMRLVREKIILESVTKMLYIHPDIGYIKIERFTGKTATELDEALNLLETKGMKKLILDLRGNSGGYLNAAVEVADRFIPGGNKILTTKGRLSSSYQEYYATSEVTQDFYPLIVLIDHGSASASEIVAGAIQDLDRGLLVGKASFGKGLVQSQYRFHDGSALLITTAKYYTPSGRAIQRDYLEMTRDEYYSDAYDDKKRNGRHRVKGRSFKTVSGRVVLGGGGINPDIQVNNKENILSKNLRLLFYDKNRHFHSFCENFFDKNPSIKGKKTEFIRGFYITDDLYREFIKLVKETDSKFARIDFSADKEDIKFLLKRELAYIIWGSDARFRVNMRRDKQLNEALKHFSKATILLTAAGY